MSEHSTTAPSLTQRELDVIEILKMALLSLKARWASSLSVPLVLCLLYYAFAYFQFQEAMEASGGMDTPSEAETFARTMGAGSARGLLTGVGFSLILSISLIFPLRRAVDYFQLRPNSQGNLGLQTLQLTIGSILLGLASLAGLALCLVPGAFLMVAFMMFPAALVVQDSGFKESFERAYRTFSVRKGKILALFFLLILMTSLVYFIVALPALVYYGFALFQMVAQNRPEMLAQIAPTMMLLNYAAAVLSVPFAIGLTGHTLVAGYENFRHFIPNGPEF